MPQSAKSILSDPNQHQFLSGGGEMGALISSYDWSATSIGPMKTWPQSLRTTLGIIINSKFPMFLFWGPELLCFYNDAYRPSLGNEGKHPALGKPGAEVWPEIWDNIKPLIDNVLSGGDATFSENQLLPIYRNGKLEDVYWTFSYSPVYDETGRPAGVFVTCTETTETVNSLQQLELSEQRFQNLVREATVGIVVLIGQEMRIELVNEVYGKLINSTPDELLNKNLFDIVPEAQSFFRPLLLNVMETGEPLHLYDTKYSVTVKGKKIEGYLNVVYQPYREKDGTITGVMALCHDVTEAVKDRRNKDELERRFRSLLEESPVASCLWIGPQFITEIANDTMIRYWGKGNSVIGKPLTEALPELLDQPYIKILEQIYNTGIAHEEKNAEVVLVVDDKPEIFYFDYTYKPLFDYNGQVYGIMNVAVDVTEKVHARQRLEKSEQNLRNIIKQAPVAMALLKGREFIIDIVNEKTLEFWGKTDEEATGKPLFDVRSEIKGRGYEEILQEVYNSGITYSAYGAETIVIRNGKQETVYVSFTYEPYREADGTISAVMAVFAEVTEEVLSRRKIEESEARFRNLIATAPMAIGVFMGRDLIVETTNQPFIDIVGKGPDIVGKPLREVMPELVSEGQPFLQILDDVFTTGKMYQTFGTQVKIVQNGIMTENYYDITYTPITDSNGRIYGILDIAVDVTQNILAQQKIEESEKNLRNTIAQAPVAMCILRGNKHIVEIANARMLELWGKTDEDMIQKPLFIGLPEAKDQGFELLLDHVYKTGETVKAYEVPVTLPRNSGLEIVYVDFVYEAFRESATLIVGVMVIAIDVTEQVIARKRIEEAEASARLAIDSASLGVYQVDLNSQETVTSERFNAIWGTDKPLPRRQLAESIHPDDRELRLKAHESALLTGSLQYETRIVWPKDRSQHWIKVMGRVLYDESGIPKTLLGVVQDITEQKEFAEQLTRLVKERTAELNRSNEDLLQFAHVASHDLKEPVRKTMVFTNMLEDQFGELLPPEGKTYLKKIQNASERMYSMIEGVLAYSTLNSSELPIENVNLNEIISSIENDLEVMIKQKGSTILRERNLPTLQGATVLLYQLFYNLINNALKFSHENVASEISIDFSERKENHTDFAEIRIADNGIGLDKQYAQRIFDAFSRLNPKDKYEGTGLGLALCKKIVERHHGTISASGKKGEGAVFTIRLPMVQKSPSI